MMSKPALSAREFEKLSAYLDGQLSAREVALLEEKILSDEIYQEALAELRTTRELLRSIPNKRVPHNFTLTPQIAGIKERKQTRFFPVLSYSSAIAGFLVVASLVLEMFGGLVLGGVRSPMMAREVPEAAFALEAQDAVSEEALEKAAEEMVTETPMIIQWGAEGLGSQTDGKGGGGPDAGAPPVVDAPANAAPEREAETAEIPQAEVMAEEAAPAEAEMKEEAVEEEMEEAVVAEAPAAETVEQEDIDIYPTAEMLKDESLPEATPTAEILEEPQPFAEGEGPILGLPSDEEAGQIIRPDEHRAVETEALPAARLSALRIVQIVLALFALLTGTLALIFRRRGRA